ncbi:MAG: hypothetical protein HZA78_08265 [Candidatus Schekmanbacteria bacterium]|nr:hypothetical protein [Candidatus Schekmanbacteria bacterium]
MAEAFPTGREVLDYCHCSEHTHALADAQYSGDTAKRLQWVEGTMAFTTEKWRRSLPV